MKIFAIAGSKFCQILNWQIFWKFCQTWTIWPNLVTLFSFRQQHTSQSQPAPKVSMPVKFQTYYLLTYFCIAWPFASFLMFCFFFFYYFLSFSFPFLFFFCQFSIPQLFLFFLSTFAAQRLNSFLFFVHLHIFSLFILSTPFIHLLFLHQNALLCLSLSLSLSRYLFVDLLWVFLLRFLYLSLSLRVSVFMDFSSFPLFSLKVVCSKACLKISTLPGTRTAKLFWW